MDADRLRLLADLDRIRALVTAHPEIAVLSIRVALDEAPSILLARDELPEGVTAMEDRIHNGYRFRTADLDGVSLTAIRRGT